MRKGTLFRLLALTRAHLGLLGLGLIALGLGAGVNLLFPEVIRRLLDQENARRLTAHPWTAAGLLVTLFAFQSLCFYFRSKIFADVGQRVVASLRNTLYSGLLNKPIEFFDRSRVGDLVSRISADTLLVQDAVSVKLSVFVRYGVQVIAGIVLMALISLRLTLAILLSLPVIIGLSLVLGRSLRRLSREQQAELGRATTIADETLKGIRIVHAFSQQQRESARFNSSIERVLSLGLSRAQVAAFFSSFVSFLMNAAIVLIMVYGVVLVSRELLTTGELTAFMLYGAIVAVSFAFIAGGIAEFTQSLGAAERIFSLLDEACLAGAPDESPSSQQVGSDEVVFDAVTFAYPSRPDQPALSEVSLTVPAGKVTALVGPSGSGKSTLVNLLLKFYEPGSGSITFGGVNLRDLSPSDLRRWIAVVPQEPQLFGVSIADNLRYGKNDATLEELEAACRQANALDFVRSLPQGFDTDVGEAGTRLSGGEKQRLAIARALLRAPRLLVLDEATSALDSRNETLIQQALAEVLKNRTALVIAHRLSTVKNADQVLVLEHGRVVQSGTHDALSRSPGLYRELVETQRLFDGTAAHPA